MNDLPPEILAAQIPDNGDKQRFAELRDPSVSANAAVAEVAYGAVRVYTGSLNEHRGLPWVMLTDAQKDMALEAVALCVYFDADSRDLHEDWLARMKALGWSYSPTGDAAAKHDPNIVDWLELRETERTKYEVFLTVASYLFSKMNLKKESDHVPEASGTETQAPAGEARAAHDDEGGDAQGSADEGGDRH